MSDAGRLIIRAKLNDQKRIYRDIVVSPNTSLYKLAGYVVYSFGFDFDHCFGYFQSPDIFGKGKDALHYELFYDIGEEIDENTRSVEKTPVNELFSAKKDKWWMLFDYGDDWVFELECIAIDTAHIKPGSVVKTVGEAPSQYGY